jgi:D-serine deaminase-like pyridoxal phosphate-dependent protein
MDDNINSIHTPAFIVNEAVALHNITAFQVLSDKTSLRRGGRFYSLAV